MSLLSLRDIGKIYVSEGSVAVGLRGVNLDFDIGEFVAVTGKSGSGKTTLLNMISGMDTYEEGELYIEGEPTSHYEQSDWELYRKKYISFIFQDYNIIESFTVLQNVELALSYIDSPKERKQRALELVERVGLTKFKNHKGSKLSGGQKQRTVIARALAKDSPIILADEPTGNLDAKTSEEIIALLAEISKNKLVIVVTHSASELERYATREIRIFDGTVERDEVLRPTGKSYASVPDEKNLKPHTFRRGIELGVHRFRAMPKLSFFMCMLMILAILGTFFSTLTTTFDLSNDMSAFVHREGRVILSKQDGEAITQKELEDIAEKLGAEDFSHYDYLYDTSLHFSKKYKDDDRKWLDTELLSYIDDGSISPTLGRTPDSSDEVMLVLPLEWKKYYGNELGDEKVEFFGRTLNVCGIKYFYDNTKQAKAIFSKEGFEKCTESCFLNGYNFGYVSADNKSSAELPSNLRSVYFGSIYVDDTLKDGEFYIASTNNKAISAAKTYKGNFNISFSWVKNTSNGIPSKEYNYTPSKLVLVGERCVVKEYEKSNDTDIYYGDGDTIVEDVYITDTSADLYISRDTLGDILENLRNPNYTQASLFFKNDGIATDMAEELREDGYYAVTSSHTFSPGEGKLLKVIIVVFNLFGWVITLLFLSLFLYICSARAIVAKRGDIAILRSMGIEVKVIKISMYVQTALAMIPSFAVLAIAALLIYLTPSLNPMFPFMHAPQYAMIVLGMLIINIYISTKYNKKMFKESVRKTLRGGAKE